MGWSQSYAFLNQNKRCRRPPSLGSGRALSREARDRAYKAHSGCGRCRKRSAGEIDSVPVVVNRLRALTP